MGIKTGFCLHIDLRQRFQTALFLKIKSFVRKNAEKRVQT